MNCPANPFKFEPNLYQPTVERYKGSDRTLNYIPSYIPLRSGAVDVRHVPEFGVGVVTWINVQHMIKALDLDRHWPTILTELRRVNALTLWEGGVRWMHVGDIVNCIIQYIPYTGQQAIDIEDQLVGFTGELYRSERRAVISEMRRIFDEQ